MDNTHDTNGQPDPSPADESSSDIWRGIDFSGTTVVLGLGTGQLIALLSEQVGRVDGNLVVVHHAQEPLQQLAAVDGLGAVPIQARPWRIPFAFETVDLLVVNGVLRQVPDRKLPAFMEEFWRVLVPGGKLRVSDILEPSEAAYNYAWAERNRLVNELATALDTYPATGVDVKRAALAAQMAGFEDLGVSILPGYLLTEAWLEETVQAIRTMASRVVDPETRDRVLDHGLRRLVASYRQGGQRAAERFVLRGTKAGDMTLTMEASFTEDDLLEPDE